MILQLLNICHPISCRLDVLRQLEWWLIFTTCRKLLNICKIFSLSGFSIKTCCSLTANKTPLKSSIVMQIPRVSVIPNRKLLITTSVMSIPLMRNRAFFTLHVNVCSIYMTDQSPVQNESVFLSQTNLSR